MPPKIWRPKQENKFTPDESSHYLDIDEECFVFRKLGKCAIKRQEAWADIPREDIIKFDPLTFSKELVDNFKIGETVQNDIRNQILDIIKKYWDSFASEGARRPIIGYEFAINTGSHTPVCKSFES